ncbi:hypothetical protein LGM85_22530 [Burkholderia multivorans]|jgi:hypothetical protein|uniref:Uncharacterized protein n=1 Tax=Burkholderia multivorans TaxID=87883 RepID=A0AAP2MST5_9BURK|nr:hypothetical protein [Burkholderia multivorans]MBU9360767.1 hypothetical protein [Burkholderia multivorans]MBY4672303.1 hypothetical protein [Burkholderia multivorans]MCA8486712.1 hypothetical protein [Burkholderia multivorans]MCO1459889.1 hypothetical protein [Burkholderia multivorans]MDR8877609.1 hypothetical protein [Burkholderia multivorans]
MNNFMLGVAIANALPVPFALMLFALLSAAFNVILGRHKVISGVAFLLLLVTLHTASLALGAAGLLLSLLAQCMNMSKPDKAVPAAAASN